MKIVCNLQQSIVFFDHLGSSRVITRSDGTVCYEADFYPYGGERVIKDECPNGYKFAGKERDSDTGLDYSGARYYGFGASRFLSPDPLLESGRVEAPQTWNRYSYALNNPLRFVDPSGLVAVCSVNGADENCVMPVEDSETTAQSEEAQNPSLVADIANIVEVSGSVGIGGHAEIQVGTAELSGGYNIIGFEGTTGLAGGNANATVLTGAKPKFPEPA